MASQGQTDTFRVLLQRFRSAAGLSQEELAERAGLSRRGISGLERGERLAPHPATVRRLAEALRLEDDDRGALIAAARAVQDGGTGASAGSSPPPVPLHHGLPAQPGALIGRAVDVARVSERLLREDVRLLTLVGAAGTGKTRLAVEVARQHAPAFADGAWFVDLSPVGDPELVLSAIAATLGVRDDRDRPLITSLQKHLTSGYRLLVLDNFEQVLPAAPLLGDLLGTCPGLKLLVTSRSALHLQWEHELALQPLAVPDLSDLRGAAELVEIASVALLVERTQRIDPEFRVDDANLRDIAEICVRLDGLPLAIELAAARLRVLSPHALLRRLSRRLVALGPGSQDQPARQRTLRAALDWSYALLSDAEQTLFRRLGVFVGGFTLEAVAEVCGPDAELDIDPLRGLESLVDKSFVRPVRVDAQNELRFGLLETIREYAVEQLTANDELQGVRRRHAEYYLSGAEDGLSHITYAQQAAWLRSLDLEHDNLRAALSWCHEAESPELGLRAAGLLAWFWEVRGHIREGRARLTALLRLASSSSAELRAESLRVIGGLALWQSDDRAARELFEESLALRRELGEPGGLVGALFGLAYAAILQNDNATARACFDEALTIQHRLGDQRGVSNSLNGLASLAHERGELDLARTWYEQCAAVAAATGYGLDVAQHNLGLVAHAQGDLEAARQYLERSVAAKRVLLDTRGLALSLAKLAEVIAAQGDLETARGAFSESVLSLRDLDDRHGLAFVLERVAIVAATHGLSERALELGGASSALRELVAVPLSPSAQSALDTSLASAWQALPHERATEVWARGRALSLERATSLAIESQA